MRVPAEVVRVLITGINLIKASVLPSLGKLSCQSGRKILPLRKKSNPLLNYFFKMLLGWCKFCVYCLEKYNISLIWIRENKRWKINFKKLCPFFALSVQTWLQLCMPLYFLTALFELCHPIRDKVFCNKFAANHDCTFVTRYDTPKPATQKSPVKLGGVLKLRSINLNRKMNNGFPVVLLLRWTLRNSRFQK